MTATEELEIALRRRLSARVDASSLAVFRILYGSVMFWAMVRFLARGWVKTIYLDPAFHFPWVSFIRPWPGAWMFVHVGILAACALGLALGIFYRISAALFCFGFTYLEFIDRTAYLNHYYLAGLFSLLLVFMPANCRWSLDASRRPELASATVPVWTVWLLRFQLVIVYLFAGLAKLNTEWLVSAEPLRIWLMACSDLPVIGKWLAEPWAAVLASWLGALHDLAIPFLFLSVRTRVWGLVAAILFHVSTALLFPIGMFPWIMLSAITLFFAPDWPRWLVNRFGSLNGRVNVLPQNEALLSRAGMWLIAVYCLLQILIPARSWFYPQQGAWEARGFNFAWRVMLVEKTGAVEFFAVNPATGERKPIALSDYVTPRQQMIMAQDPFQIRALAQYLGRQSPGSEIHADAYATLNGRPSQRIIRPDIDLAAPVPVNWIVPLEDK